MCCAATDAASVTPLRPLVNVYGLNNLPLKVLVQLKHPSGGSLRLGGARGPCVSGTTISIGKTTISMATYPRTQHRYLMPLFAYPLVHYLFEVAKGRMLQQQRLFPREYLSSAPLSI